MSIKESVVRPSLTRIEDVRQFLAGLWSASARQSTVFVGAGISVPTPSCLPSAKDVIEQVIHALADHPGLGAQRRDLLESVQRANIKLEVLLEIVQRTAASNLTTLFKVFDGHNPNLYHHFLARLLKVNSISHIVTTNFDRLIEKAFRDELNVFVTEADHDERSHPAIYKIHGTVERPETIVAVLKQVSRGLGSNKRQLLLETLSRTCVVLGWSDDDIDLTPAFFQAQGGLLIWFSFDPGAMSVVDFSVTTLETPNLHPKVERLLRERRGIIISCDPMLFLLTIWRDIEKYLGPIPALESEVIPDSINVISTWANPLTLFERLIIVSDIFRHLADWQHAQLLLKQAEEMAITPANRFSIHYRLGLCFTNLSRWQDAFDSYDLCLVDKGYEGSIEQLLDVQPIEDPDLAMLYGNVAALFHQVGRTQDSVACHERDAELSERFFLENRSSAYGNLAMARCQLGDWAGAMNAANKAAVHGLEEGDLVSVALSHQALANCAVASGDWHKVQLELEAANEISVVLSRPDFQVECLKGLAEHCYRIGDIDRSCNYVNVALDMAAGHDLTDLQAELWMVMGVALKESACLLYPLESLSTAPELQQSLEAYEKSLEFFAKKGSNKKLKSIILNNRGLLFRILGDYERAYRDLWESLELRTSLLDDIGRATVLNNLALLMLGSNESEEFLLEALSIYDRFGHKIGRCQVTHDLAGVHMTRLRQLRKSQLVKRRREHRKTWSYLQESLRIAEELRAPAKIKQAQHNLKVLESLSSLLT